MVDDVNVNRHLLRDLRSPLGFLVTLTYDGATALAAMKQDHFDAVILDLRMPGVDGLELTRRIRTTKGPQPRVVLTSASVLSFDSQIAFDAGCDDFLPKPFRAGELLQRLGRTLRLAWVHENPEVASNPTIAIHPDVAWMNELQQAAGKGDIRRIRSLLLQGQDRRTLDGLVLSELAELAAAYQMDRLRLTELA
ncbi:MAG: response regulator [Candidatus Synoicihabitans palmerolidicus]|nr:response regulator [Candidatus Synoicihabitans palmerolidicus]